MLQLIKRSPEYVSEFKKYCEEFYANKVIYFMAGLFVFVYRLNTILSIDEN